MVKKAFKNALLIQIIAAIVGVIGMIVDGAITGSCLGTKVMTGFALADSGVTGIIAGFFVLLVQHFNYIAQNYKMLIHDIETGTIDEKVEMPAEVRASLLKKITPMPERAAELREIFKNGSDFRFVKAVWPNMQFIRGVGGDGFSVYANTIRSQYADESVKFILSGVNA